MNRKALITYATRTGSTEEIARVIGEQIASRGWTVDVIPLDEQPLAEDYQVVIIGSAIRIGQWLPEAVRFVAANKNQLRRQTTAFFCVHQLNLEDDDTSRKNRQAYLDSARELVTPSHEAYFAGRLEMERLSAAERFLTRAVKAPQADLRDWQSVRNWAAAIDLGEKVVQI